MKRNVGQGVATKPAVMLGAARLTIGDIVDVADGRRSILFSEAAEARIEASARMLASLATAGERIYGVTTGLGAAVDTALQADDDVQRRVPLARCVGVGRISSRRELRAIIATRAARLAQGCSGASLAAARGLADLIERDVQPVIPMTGSIGEGDLAPLAAIAAVLIGQGFAILDGEIIPGAVALERAGLAPIRLVGKDGLALVSSNAASIGPAVVCVADAQQVLSAAVAAGALSFEAYRCSLNPVSEAALALRPLPGQETVAGALRGLLEGGTLARPGAARRLQDPLSFRCIAPVMGAAVAALDAARDIVEVELNSSDDNPAILAEGHSLPNANFDTTHLTLTFEALGLACARVAAMVGERIMKLMSPASSDLPRFLSPIQNGRNGYATVQKTVAALVAEIQHRANPMPVVVLPVADRVEDYATMATAVVEKTAEIVTRLRLLIATELMVAAQAVDLREAIALGRGSASVRATVREAVATLTEDRPATPDIEALDAMIAGGAFGGFGRIWREAR
ncbi:MAG: HAL/PAL/TAL family ammonia-lyase [Bosea sp. (in: a-proteobacteria)]|uniref:HAL/PAL/TAL family ammonia-lyase n=1 Tax=Bosea sp. (in: a-proteobacteria) TaxID=1871050 RepID=UPI003F7B469C